jgi:hypothetical protein
LLTNRIAELGAPSALMPYAGSVFGVGIALAALVSELDRKNSLLKTIAAIALPAIFGYLVGGVWLKDMALASAMMLGVAGGAAIHFLLPADEEATSLSVGIASVIAVGLATVAFALSQGMGMAATLLAAVGVLGILGNRTGLLALGPLFGLVLFRIFRTIYPETARAFDIGQHYALIGLLLGAVVPLLVVDWSERKLSDTAKVGGATLWGLLLLAATPLMMVFLGAYGTVGLLIGVGLAGVLEAIRLRSSTKALAPAIGMGGIVLMSYGWMSEAIDLTREDKVRVLVWAVVGIGLLSLAIFGISRNKEVQ